MIQGMANIFFMNINSIVHHQVIKVRMKHIWSQHCLFIDKFNLHKFGKTYNFRGVLICVRIKIFKLAMILQMNYKGVIILIMKNVKLL